MRAGSDPVLGIFTTLRTVFPLFSAGLLFFAEADLPVFEPPSDLPDDLAFFIVIGILLDDVGNVKAIIQ
jgi:hypothetical protein